ncbi:hypothetical protein QQS21_008788 [Conoideocrella luteorostrata]|uniref:Major facilitator superfamily (MFS) profile domain-containing protein n=1 Tax=Conoideocrella luteorostrata TaxID=1105319 RepID=A0AAJ0CJ38_9HYPO|nr:hypothetical protein QQS21_008788 [Conoideocrella luteorostrata]
MSSSVRDASPRSDLSPSSPWAGHVPLHQCLRNCCSATKTSLQKHPKFTRTPDLDEPTVDSGSPSFPRKDEEITTERIEVISDSSPHTPVDDDSVDVSYGSGGMKGIVHFPYIFAVAFPASIGGFSFGYDQGVMSIINIMPQFLDVFPEVEKAFWKGCMTGMLELGACIGCLFMPWLADKISRKRAIAVVVVIFNIGAILQTAAVSYEMLVAGRTIGGIGVGTLAMGAPIYISEIAPPNLRGTLLALEAVSIVLGAVTALWITYGTRDMAGEIAFRLPIGLQMVSATVVGIGLNFFFPYSPR